LIAPNPLIEEVSDAAENFDSGPTHTGELTPLGREHGLLGGTKSKNIYRYRPEESLKAPQPALRRSRQHHARLLGRKGDGNRDDTDQTQFSN